MKVMERSPDSPSSPYFVCPSCGVIARDASGAMKEPNTPAPCCGATGDIRGSWPPLAVATVMSFAGSQGRHPQPSALLYAAVAQALLEAAVLHMVKLESPTDRTGSLLLEGKRDIVSLITVHDTLSEAPLTSVLGDEFVENILDLARLRDAIVADFFHAVTDKEAEIIGFTGTHLLESFMLLHNDIVRRFKDAGREGKHGKRILIVDDEPKALDHMGRFVERQGITALRAPNGAEALRLYREHKPDCVFLDVSLPDMDGLSVLAGMKESGHVSRIYFVTGIGGEAFAKEAERLGAAGYLSKPIDLVSLAEIVKSV